jgi:hypothetical protein
MKLAQPEAFVLTLLIEGVVAALLAPAFKSRRDRASLSAILGSAITQPVVWYGALALYPVLGVVATLGLVEVGAVIFEAVGYWGIARLRPGPALILSALVNASSFVVGLVIPLL